MNRHLALPLCLIISLFCFSVVSAQTIPVGGGLQLSASPSNPIPDQTVTITAASYSEDLSSARIAWTVNGAAQQNGIGMTTLEVQAPPLGNKLNIAVTVIPAEGNDLTGTIVIGSGSVDMIVETDGYTPPGFLGKIAPVYQNDVTIVAVPHLVDSSGVEIDPSTLIYQWKQNDTALADQSGYGKQSLSLPGSLIPRPYVVTVDVSLRSGDAQGEGTIAVTPQAAPAVGFYVDDPLYGPLYNTEIGPTIRIGSQKEVSVLAVPYGFDGNLSDGTLSLNWLINGETHPELSSSKSIVLRAPDGTSGTSDIELQTSSSHTILQSADSGFSVMFSADTPTSAGVSGSQAVF